MGAIAKTLLTLTAAAFFVSAAGAAEATTSPLTNRPSASPTDLTNHLKQLLARLPRGFTWTWQPPFVVVGDEPPNAVRQHATNTVKWAVDRLKRDYFKRDPSPIVEIWLFKDKTSYEKWARELFNDTPTTPFGYFSPQHNALLMNISTGGGTLVHEIVHPFVRANFPSCPAWFNEGLASLYEQSGSKGDRIYGYPNWRLPALQEAIRTSKALPFEKLLALPDDEFYGGSNSRSYSQHYAQARYLCYYLQEQGLLVKFYHAFVAGAKDDPTGVKTLKKVLGESDLEAFRHKWEKFVSGLQWEQ
ncbi:MAG TPA: hypothetical protein VFT34_09315 [Verrucomicrobiae bacterium]|nr:hypothetical protein [Verrucomicrobiae bacterium]